MMCRFGRSLRSLECLHPLADSYLSPPEVDRTVRRPPDMSPNGSRSVAAPGAVEAQRVRFERRPHQRQPRYSALRHEPAAVRDHHPAPIVAQSTLTQRRGFRSHDPYIGFGSMM